MRVSCAAVLFDVDGTLVDSSGPIRRAWTAFARRWNVDGAELARVAHGRRDHEIVAEFLPPAQRPEGVALVRSHELSDLADVVAIPGAVEVLAGLAAAPWAVVTSARPDLAAKRLAAAHLPAPPVVVTADDVERGKPDPQGYLIAARRLGVPAADCVVVEDAPSGIAAGRAAGARVLAVATTYRAEHLAGADWVVPDLRAVRARPGILLESEGTEHAR